MANQSTARSRFKRDMGAVMKNLNAELAGVKGRAVDGLLAAGLLFINKSIPFVPREHGNLVGSAFARKAQSNPNAVAFGYDAAYALYVHENMGQKLKGQPRPSGLGVYWGPSGQPKFLEAPVRDNIALAVKVVASYAQARARRGR